MFNFLLMCIIAFNLYGATLGGNDTIETDVLHASATFTPDRIEAGSQGHIKIKLDLDPKHHAYSERFKLKVESPTDIVSVGAIELSPVVEFFDKVSGSNKKGIVGEATMTAVFEVVEKAPIGIQNINLQLTYQACTDEYCLLPKMINVPAQVEIFQSKVNDVPTDFKSALNRGLLWTFLFVFFAGILTSFTPCIYPMIPITLAIIGSRGASKSRRRSFLLSLIYVFGIGITYAIFGLIAASTGSLFGSALSSPWVTAVISLLLLSMALSLFGLFEVQIPHFVQKRLTQRKTSKGYGGVFATGLIAGAVASPCVGPVLVSLLAYIAQTQNLALGFCLLFTFAMGMGLLLVTVGTFSQVFHRLPKSGLWMVGVKIFFGIMLLGASFYYARPLLAKFVPALAASTSAQSPENLSRPKWQPYSEAALQKATKQGLPVIIDFWADWCEACHELEKHTFTDPKIVELSDKFVMLKFDATESSNEVTRITKHHSVIGLPTILFFDKAGKRLENLTLTGFEPASDFVKRINEVLKSDCDNPSGESEPTGQCTIH